MLEAYESAGAGVCCDGDMVEEVEELELAGGWGKGWTSLSCSLARGVEHGQAVPAAFHAQTRSGSCAEL